MNSHDIVLTAVREHLSWRLKREPWLGSFFETAREHHWSLAFFGGCIRDATMFGELAEPRDIDLVVGCSDNTYLDDFVTSPEMSRHLRSLTMTGLGGWHLETGLQRIDMWPASKTAALSHVPASQIHLGLVVQSTFLTSEAVACLIDTRSGLPYRVLEEGFVRTIESGLARLVGHSTGSVERNLACYASLAYKTQLRFDDEVYDYFYEACGNVDDELALNYIQRRLPEVAKKVLQSLYEEMKLASFNRSSLKHFEDAVTRYRHQSLFQTQCQRW